MFLYENLKNIDRLPDLYVEEISDILYLNYVM